MRPLWPARGHREREREGVGGQREGGGGRRDGGRVDREREGVGGGVGVRVDMVTWS